MIRCTIELVPHGDEKRITTLGCVEIANVGPNAKDLELYNYVVVLKKSAPFKGALKETWRRGKMYVTHEDEEVIVGQVEGFHRTKRGAYDLLYQALVACGLAARSPDGRR